MIINQPRFSAYIIPFAGALDIEKVAALKNHFLSPDARRAVVVIDCTSMQSFTETELDELLALRRCVERLGVGKVMVAIKHQTPFGQTITRLIPAGLRILMQHLPRYMRLPQGAFVG
ncbi:hypothetical protein J7643_05755 [bacterium]|nr:hypothetical protein [bacterium]